MISDLTFFYAFNEHLRNDVNTLLSGVRVAARGAYVSESRINVALPLTKRARLKAQISGLPKNAKPQVAIACVL